MLDIGIVKRRTDQELDPSDEKIKYVKTGSVHVHTGIIWQSKKEKLVPVFNRILDEQSRNR
jgi:hypothetical protein